MTLQEIKQQLKPLILTSLRITDVAPDEFGDSQPLLDGDLEIDSIDILQLIVEIEKKYGIRLVTGKFDREAWRDVNSLAAAILAKVEERAQT
ncbi:MAG: phosphopantetheine-binding protein [Bryobacteraceae bacterium]|jgi:acyl carrier protein